MRTIKSAILICLFCMCCSLSMSITINIPADQPTIQEGIDTSANGDTVLVQPGTYFENINYNGHNITVASLFLTTQDTSYISQTVIDGNQSGSVVTFESEEDSTTVLCGFTITNGYYFDGGGIYCLGTSPTLQDIRILNNTAYDVGDENGWGLGGGLYCNNSSVNVFNVEISNNNASGDIPGGGAGGGAHFMYSTPRVNNVIFRVNSAYSAGAISAWHSTVKLDNIVIVQNSAILDSGIQFHYTTATINNSTIINNESIISTGALHCGPDSSVELTNCILNNNFPIEISLHNYNSDVTLSISYSDIQGGLEGIETNGNGEIFWLEGNIDEDPLFIGTGDYPFTLSENSPCIDTGTPDTIGLNLPPWDIIGNERIWDGDEDGVATIDMGAYEFGSPEYVEITNDELQIMSYELSNYPNPFNPVTTFSFNITQSYKHAEMEIYNIKGQLVETSSFDSAQDDSMIWNAEKFSSGVYFYKLVVDGKEMAVKKCLLLK